jgi:hypothetical protein
VKPYGHGDTAPRFLDLSAGFGQIEAPVVITPGKLLPLPVGGETQRARHPV